MEAEVSCMQILGGGVIHCELPQAKPKIAQILPSLNFKASHFSPVVTGWGLAAWVVPLPKHSPSQGTTTYASQKTPLINTPCLPLTAHPCDLGKVYYIQTHHARPRQHFSTVIHRPALREATWHLMGGKG